MHEGTALPKAIEEIIGESLFWQQEVADRMKESTHQQHAVQTPWPAAPSTWGPAGDAKGRYKGKGKLAAATWGPGPYFKGYAKGNSKGVHK